MIRDIKLEALRDDGLTLGQVAWNLQLTRWVNAAAMSLLIYDTVLILADEVRLVWPKRWNTIKVFYFLNRALCAIFTIISCHQDIDLHAVSDIFCVFNILGVGVGTFIAYAMCDWIFLARTRALVVFDYPHLDVGLVIYFAISFTVAGALAIITFQHVHGTIFYSPTLRTCSATIHPKTMGPFWISPMVFEATIFILATFKIHQNTRSHNGHLASHLFSVLFRDGVCYYVSICIFRIWNLVLWNMRPISPTYMGMMIHWSIMSIASSRLQLNLLEATALSHDTRVNAGILTTHDITTFGHRTDGNRWGRRPRRSPNSADACAPERKHDTYFHSLFSSFIPSLSRISNFTAKTKDSHVSGAQIAPRTSTETQSHTADLPVPMSPTISTSIENPNRSSVEASVARGKPSTS